MADKEDKLEFDDMDLGLDDDLAGLTGDFDISEPPPKNTREAVLSSIKNGAKGFAEGMTDDKLGSAMDIASAAIPDSVSSEVSQATDIKDTLKSEITKAGLDVKKHANQTFAAMRRYIPESSTKLNSVADKIAGFLGGEETSKGPSKEQINNDEIAAMLEKTLGAKDKHDKIEELVNKQIDLDRTKTQQQLLNSINTNTGYNRKFSYEITSSYYRRNLEVAYKSLFVQKEHLEATKGIADVFKNQLEALVKNTALPDIIKTKNSEAFIHKMKLDAGTKLTESFFNNDKSVGGKIASNIKEKVEGLQDKIMSGLGVVDDTLSVVDTMNSMGGLNKSNMAGNVLADFLKSKVGKKLGKELEKTDKGKELIYKMKNGMADMSGTINDHMQNVNNPILRAMLGQAAEILDTKSVKGYTLEKKDINSVTTFDNRTKTSIIKVIPELLGKIYATLKSSTIAGKGKSADELSYNHVTDKFETRKDIVKNIRSEVRSNTENGTAVHAEGIINLLEKHGEIKLDSPSKSKVREALLRYVFNKGTLSLDAIASNKFYKLLPKDITKQLKPAFNKLKKAATDDPSILNSFNAELDGIGSSTKNMQNTFSELHERGMSDIGVSEGYLKKNDNGGYELDKKGLQDKLVKSLGRVNTNKLKANRDKLDKSIEEKKHYDKLSKSQQDKYKADVAKAKENGDKIPSVYDYEIKEKRKSKIPGGVSLKLGGWSTDAPKDQVVGVIHGQEFVTNADRVNKLIADSASGNNKGVLNEVKDMISEIGNKTNDKDRKSKIDKGIEHLENAKDAALDKIDRTTRIGKITYKRNKRDLLKYTDKQIVEHYGTFLPKSSVKIIKSAYKRNDRGLDFLTYLKTVAKELLTEQGRVEANNLRKETEKKAIHQYNKGKIKSKNALIKTKKRAKQLTDAAIIKSQGLVLSKEQLRFIKNHYKRYKGPYTEVEYLKYVAPMLLIEYTAKHGKQKIDTGVNNVKSYLRDKHTKQYAQFKKYSQNNWRDNLKIAKDAIVNKANQYVDIKFIKDFKDLTDKEQQALRTEFFTSTELKLDPKLSFNRWMAISKNIRPLDDADAVTDLFGKLRSKMNVIGKLQTKMTKFRDDLVNEMMGKITGTGLKEVTMDQENALRDEFFKSSEFKEGYVTDFDTWLRAYGYRKNGSGVLSKLFNKFSVKNILKKTRKLDKKLFGLTMKHGAMAIPKLGFHTARLGLRAGIGTVGLAGKAVGLANSAPFKGLRSLDTKLMGAGSTILGKGLGAVGSLGFKAAGMGLSGAGKTANTLFNPLNGATDNVPLNIIRAKRAAYDRFNENAVNLGETEKYNDPEYNPKTKNKSKKDKPVEEKLENSMEKIADSMMDIKEKRESEKDKEEAKKAKDSKKFDKDGDGKRDGSFLDRLNIFKKKPGEKTDPKKAGILKTIKDKASSFLNPTNIFLGILAATQAMGITLDDIKGFVSGVKHGFNVLRRGLSHIPGLGGLAPNDGEEDPNYKSTKAEKVGTGVVAGLAGYAGYKTVKAGVKVYKAGKSAVTGTVKAAKTVKSVASKISGVTEDVEQVSAKTGKKLGKKAAKKAIGKAVTKKAKAGIAKKIIGVLKRFKGRILKRFGKKAAGELLGKLAAKITGRLLPFLGWALLIYDAGYIIYYMTQGHSLLSAVSLQILGFDLFNNDEVPDGVDMKQVEAEVDSKTKNKQSKSGSKNKYDKDDYINSQMKKDAEGQQPGESVNDYYKRQAKERRARLKLHKPGNTVKNTITKQQPVNNADYNIPTDKSNTPISVFDTKHSKPARINYDNPNLSLRDVMDNLKKDEGTVNHVYKDSLGYDTIGTGHLVDKHKGIPLKKIIGYDTSVITNKQSDYVLAYDIARTSKELYKRIPWLKNHPSNIQGDMVNMAFNLGVPGLLKFTTALKHLKTGDYQTAAAHFMRSKWYNQVGNRAKRIVGDIYNTNPPIFNNSKDNTGTTVANATMSKSVLNVNKQPAGLIANNSDNTTMAKHNAVKLTLNGGKDNKLPNINSTSISSNIEHNTIAKASHSAIKDVHSTLKDSYEVQARMLATLEEISKTLPTLKSTTPTTGATELANVDKTSVNNVLNGVNNNQFSNPAINLRRTTVNSSF